MSSWLWNNLSSSSSASVSSQYGFWTSCLVGFLAFGASGVMARSAGAMVGLQESAMDANAAAYLGVTVAATIYLVQYLTSSPPGGEEFEVNTDKTMTWREDNGISKLVPLIPEPLSKKTKKKTTDEELPKYTMAEVAKRSTAEESWIIVDGRVYDITNFIDKHPGGPLVLTNMAGKDCTDAFANYHQAHVYKYMLPPILVGQVTDMPLYPHVEDFRAIRQELLRRGLFETDMRYYTKLGLWFASLLGSALYCALALESTTAHMIGAVLLGLFWQQLAGLGHDLGHSGVSHNFYLDHWVGSVFGCALMGISTGWWKRSHNTHHVVCNSVENDPDIQHMPVMAVTNKQLEKPYWSSYHSKWFVMDHIAKFLISYQHYLFIPLMMVARFNLYAQSWIMILTPSFKMYNRVHEACALLFFLVWNLAVALKQNTWFESVAFVLLSHAVGGILHIQIVISHWSMETYHGNAYNSKDDEWYLMQIKTTMNVDCPPWLDFVHIGLQFQIEHHLFPTLPRHNLRIAREMVKEVCRKHNIYYHEPGFFQAVAETIEALRRTALDAQQGKAVPNLLVDAMNAAG